MNYLTILLVSSQWVWSEKRVKAKALQDYRLSRGRNPFDLCLEKTQTLLSSRKAFLWESIKGLFQWASWLQVLKAGFNELGESTVQVPLQVQFSSQVLKGRTFIKGRFATRLKVLKVRVSRPKKIPKGRRRGSVRASLVRASLFPLRIKSFLDRTLSRKPVSVPVALYFSEFPEVRSDSIPLHFYK